MIRTLLASAALSLAALPAAAEQLSLSEISSYLNSFKSAQGKFTQINEDQTISTGQIYIKRPGRVRFEYDPPEAARTHPLSRSSFSEFLLCFSCFSVF